MNNEVTILASEDEECLSVTDDKVECVIDTTTSYHDTPSREIFITYKAGDFCIVKMGNTSYSKVVGLVMSIYKPMLVA